MRRFQFRLSTLLWLVAVAALLSLIAQQVHSRCRAYMQEWERVKQERLYPKRTTPS